MEFSTKSDGLKSPNPSDIDFATLYVELNEDDNQWLAKFGVDTSNGSIDRLNNYISEDIEDMRPDYDPALRQHIVTNRRNFFIDLAIEEQAFSHRETSHPLKRTVATIRYYHHLSLDAAKVVNVFPNALCYNPESVKVKIDNLTELGLDAVKLVNTFPSALALNPESAKAKMDNLTELGLDAVKVVNTNPVALGYNPSKINIAAYKLNESWSVGSYS